MIPPFDSTIAGVLKEISTSIFSSSYRCSLLISPTRTSPTNITVSLRLDPATEITPSGMWIIFQAGICQRPKIHVAMRLRIFLDDRDIHSLISSTRYRTRQFRPRAPITSSTSKFTSLQSVKHIFEPVVAFKPTAHAPSQQVSRRLSEFIQQDKTTLRV